MATPKAARDRSETTNATLKRTTVARMKDFSDGVGGTYDALINFLMDEASKSGENAFEAGARLREKFQKQYKRGR